ncbi:MAG: sulfatase-like hydrolase/transferase, partial [Oscillospiraceae bacterium]|nr:sulfatase-like hydrolase/transferase [Oscillospiraceae bacterium]
MLAINAKFYFLNPDFYSKIESFSYISNPTNIYHRNTFHTAFLFYINNTVVTPPEDYSKETVTRLLDASDNKTQQTRPDVILILLESYFDPNSLFGLEFTDSINENYNSIAKKAVYGNMLSFKYGGGTADIEFNILNQLNTTYFTEALSYMNIYGNKKLPSFVQDLKAADYSTYAMHAYTSQLYNRIKAYQNMGFDGSKFIDTYSNTDTYGSYISDISHVDEMIEKYEEYVTSGAENIFLYGVSMQNHMYMSQENLTDRIYLKDTGYSRAFTDGMGILASYMRQTDMAIKKLYDYFEQVDREVVIILYGDHQSYNIEGIGD